MMTNSIHSPHPCLEIFSCLLNWRLSEGMRLCWCHRLMHWPGGGTPSCQDGRQVREVNTIRGGAGGGGRGGLQKVKNEQGEKGKHLQPNATILIWTLLQLIWQRSRLLRWSHPLYVTALNSSSWCIFQEVSPWEASKQGLRCGRWFHTQPFSLNRWDPTTGFWPLMHS